MVDEGEDVVVGQLPTVMVPRHIKKRSLKNKALSIGFNDKDLSDFVGGFHKRKKKRRKEAQRHLQEKDRLKRIATRKKRKQEREFVLFGGVPQEDEVGSGSGPDDNEDASDHNEDETNMNASKSDSKTYEIEDTKIVVTTTELSHEVDDPMKFTPNAGTKYNGNQRFVAKKVVKQKSRKRARNSASRKQGSKRNKR